MYRILDFGGLSPLTNVKFQHAVHKHPLAAIQHHLLRTKEQVSPLSQQATLRTSPRSHLSANAMCPRSKRRGGEWPVHKLSEAIT